MNIKTRVLGLALCALSAAACGDGGDASDTSTVTGTVTTRGETELRVAGATVGVYGTPLSTITDANGAFTLRNVPNGNVFFVTEADRNWGTVDYYYYVPEETAGIIGHVERTRIRRTFLFASPPHGARVARPV